MKKEKRGLRDRVRGSALNFKKKFKKQTTTAIVAAFAFLVALSWREPIKQSIDNLIEKLNLTGQAIYIEYLSAIIITIIAVLVLIMVSKWIEE